MSENDELEKSTIVVTQLSRELLTQPGYEASGVAPSGARGSTMRLTSACKPAADFLGRPIMTLCPVALAVGCIKCPVFKICPVKGIIGDYKKDAPPPADLKKKQ